MVIIFDNSHSMLAHVANSGQTRLARAKTLVRELLGESVAPREAAILPTNPDAAAGPPPIPALTTNMFVLAGNLEKMLPTGGVKPMQERIRTALALLHSSSQPSKMLVIVSDFARPNYADAEVFSPLKNLPWRKDLQIVLLPADAPDARPADVGITSFALAEGTQRPAVGAEVTFEAQIVNNANVADVRDLAFTVDGVPADAPAGGASAGPLHPQVQLGPAGTPTARATVRIPYRLRDPGWHRFGVQLANSADAMAWDDSRQLALDVADQIRVLVVGAESGATPRPRSAAFYFQTALAPFEGARQSIPWSIKPTYRGIDQVQAAALRDFSAVFLCDVPRIAVPLADALAAYAKSSAGAASGGGGSGGGGGGRLIWILGPSVDSANYNQTLVPRGLLPAPLAQPLVAAKALPLDWVDIRSGLFMNLFDNQDPFRTALIMGRWSLAGDPATNPAAAAPTPPAGRILARLSDGSPLFLRHSAVGPADTGRIYTLLTTPAADWSNLGGTVLLVPLATRMALGDYQEDAAFATSFDTGQLVPLHIPAMEIADPSALRRLSVDITTPGSGVLNVKPTVVDNAAQWLFDRTADPGTYTWKSSDSRYTGTFVVNPPGDEADLLPADLTTLARESSPPGPPADSPAPPTLIANTVPELLAQLAHRGEGASLTPGFLAIVLMLAVLEALMANRHRCQLTFTCPFPPCEFSLTPALHPAILI